MVVDRTVVIVVVGRRASRGQFRGGLVSCCMLLALAVMKLLSSEYVWKELRVPDAASAVSGGPDG